MSSKIKVDTIETVAGSGNITLSNALVANSGVSIDNITIDGTEIDLSSGNLTLDVANFIILDADGGRTRFADNGTIVGSIQSDNNNFNFVGEVSDGDIVFSGNDGGSGIEAMRIDMSAGGNVGIGTASPSQKLHVEGAGNHFILLNNSTTDDGFYFKAGTGESAIQTNGGSHKITFYTSGNERMSIDDAGRFRVPSAYSSTTGSGANVRVQTDGKLERSTSSLRYKNTIKDATHGLDDLLKLRSVTFKGNNDGDTIFGGLIAEEVHDAGLTEFVEYDDQNRPDALHYGNMVALCVKAIQELSAKNDALEARVKELESK